MDAGGVLIDGIGHLGQAPLRPHSRDQLHKGRLPFIDHRAVEVLEQRRLGQHIAQARHRIAADRHMDMRKVLLDEGAEGHRREHLLLEDDGNPDHIRLLRLDHRLDQLIEDIPVDIDLFVVHRVDDFGGDVDLVREIRFHRRHADPRWRIDH